MSSLFKSPVARKLLMAVSGVFLVVFLLVHLTVNHIIMGIVLELKNAAARPIKYAKNNAGANSTWASRNMIVTGVMILAFLVLHIINYFVPFKFGEVHDHYELVTALFENPVYTIVYVIAFILLGMHLSHGFQSSMTTLGLRSAGYKKFFITLGIIFSYLIAIGFSAIAVYFFLK